MTASQAELLELPRTPAEAKRHWMIHRLWAGNLFSFVAVLFLVLIVWLGGWPESLAALRLKILGCLAAAFIARCIIADLSFSLGGPVGRWRARWGDREFSADDDAAVRNAYDGRAE